MAYRLSQEEIDDLRFKEFTALLYSYTVEDILKNIKEEVKKCLTPVVKCEVVKVILEEDGCNIFLQFEDESAKISLTALTVLEVQYLTKDYLVKNYGIRTTI